MGRSTTIRSALRKLCATTKAETWWRLGQAIGNVTDTVAVNGQDYTRLECHIKALMCDLSSDGAWCSLGIELGLRVVTIEGKEYSSKQCYVEELRRNPLNRAARVHLFITMVSGEILVGHWGSSNEASYFFRKDTNRELRRIPGPPETSSCSALHLSEKEPMHQWEFP